MGFLSRLGRKERNGNVSPMEIIIPLRLPPVIDTKKVSECFARRWGTKVRVEEDLEPPEVRKGREVHILTDGRSKVLVTGSSEPLSKAVCKSLTDLLGSDEEGKMELRSNEGSLLLRSIDCGEHAVERAAFTVQALLCFLQHEDALGYSTKSGYMYHPRSWASVYFKRKTLQPVDLLTILGSIHIISDSRWIHTHGLEQFDLPDVEIRFKDRWKEEYYGDLVINTAVYCIERGPVLKVGNTAEMMGDGVVYKVVRPRLEPGHLFGKFGVIGLSKA